MSGGAYPLVQGNSKVFEEHRNDPSRPWPANEVTRAPDGSPELFSPNHTMSALYWSQVGSLLLWGERMAGLPGVVDYLQKGHRLRLIDGQVRIEEVTPVEIPLIDRGIRFDEASLVVERLICAALARRVALAERPVLSCSGGVDSFLVAMAAARTGRHMPVLVLFNRVNPRDAELALEHLDLLGFPKADITVIDMEKADTVSLSAEAATRYEYDGPYQRLVGSVGVIALKRAALEHGGDLLLMGSEGDMLFDDWSDSPKVAPYRMVQAAFPGLDPQSDEFASLCHAMQMHRLVPMPDNYTHIPDSVPTMKLLRPEIDAFSPFADPDYVSFMLTLPKALRYAKGTQIGIPATRKKNLLRSVMQRCHPTSGFAEGKMYQEEWALHQRHDNTNEHRSPAMAPKFFRQFAMAKTRYVQRGKLP